MAAHAGTVLAACPAPQRLTLERWTGQARWQAIQNAGLRYGAIRIKVDNVYDLANPDEDAWYTRTADLIHIRTRHWEVRHLLLIKPGQPVNAQKVYEAVRHLREQRFLRGADITPMGCRDGVVDVLVEVRDAWTLQVGTHFGRAGNSNEWMLKLEEKNFLGTGRAVAVGYEKSVERSKTMLEFRSPTLANTDWTLAARYEDLSDGRFVSLALDKPFLLNTTPWSASVLIQDQRLNLNYYQHGTRAWYMPQRERHLHANWQRLLSFTGDTAIRAGIALDYGRYRYGVPVPMDPGGAPPPVPDPRTLVGIGPVFSLHQDHFATFENLQAVQRAEDYNLGWDASAQLLWNSTALGASRNGPGISMTARKGFEPFPHWLVLADGSLSARHDDDGWRNVAFNATATAYGQPWRRQTLVFHADYASLLHPDPENRLYIGGFQALRGYPNFYATGSRRVRVTVADRIVTPMVWFHTFQVGFVAFADAATIDRGAGRGWSPWYSSAGAGFRLGNLRGSFKRVLYFTVAVPLRTGPDVRRQLQFVVGNVLNF